MRTHFSRPEFFEGARDVAPMLIGIVPFGIVCGIGAITAGASPIAALAMSMIMFSGAAQIIAIQLLAAGAPFAVILLSCLVVSLRLVMYSAAMAPYLRPLDHRWRALLSFVLTDQAFAGTLQRFQSSDDVRANASYFLGSGALLWVIWQLATLAGILAGQIIPASWQLEFVVPLCFSGQKQFHYLFPAMPALAVLTGWVIDQLLDRGELPPAKLEKFPTPRRLVRPFASAMQFSFVSVLRRAAMAARISSQSITSRLRRLLLRPNHARSCS